MTAPAAVLTVPYIEGAPERTFRITDVGLDGQTLRGAMQSGPWNLGPDGRGSAGSLGVLVDDMLGYLPAIHRPEGLWAVSTQIHIDFAGPVPTDGSQIRAWGQMVSVDQVGGLARGEVLDATGSTIAVATQRVRFVSTAPPAELLERRVTTPPDQAPPDSRPLLEVLGGRLHRHEEGSRLQVPLGPAVSNPINMLHGGIALCAMQIAGQDAVQRDDRHLTTTSITASYLRPGPVTGEAVFEATTVHRSRSVGVAEVVLRNGHGQVCTRATVMSQAL